MNGAEMFLDVLARAGVDTVFGLPGSTEAALLEALREHQGIRYVLGLHEGAVVSMADGYARATGRPGLALLHTSVGTLNGASQIYNAFRDGSPVVVAAGHKDRTVLSEDGFCAHPHLPEVVRPFTKWAWQTLSAAELGRDLWRALHAAMTPPTGPCYLAVPEDFLRGPVPDAAPAPPLGNTALWQAGGPVPVYRRHQARHVAVVADREDVMWALAEDGVTWQSLAARDQMLAALAKGYIRHDIYVQQIWNDFHEVLEQRYGPGMQQLVADLTITAKPA